MRSYQIQDIRGFMNRLLLTDTFDTFLLSEASITTFASFHIDGTFHPEYLSRSEAELLTSEQCGYTLWKRIRPFFCDLVKGKNTPLHFRIVFRLAQHNVKKLLEQSGISCSVEEVNGLFLNIHYDGNDLTCVSGTSLRFFSLDKTLEHSWDSMLEKFFRQKEIPFC
ncbi:MAG: DUF5721 family protein [Candidatus Choladocola sp.]|nr:DUF5721 family protein [Candidatus Choladocola sp.]